jgi:hypothetical protein
MRASNAALTAIANTGDPDCCKQSVRTVIEIGVELLKEHFDVKLPIQIVRECKFPAKNSYGCKGVRCSYFK